MLLKIIVRSENYNLHSNCHSIDIDNNVFSKVLELTNVNICSFSISMKNLQVVKLKYNLRNICKQIIVYKLYSKYCRF